MAADRLISPIVPERLVLVVPVPSFRAFAGRKVYQAASDNVIVL